MKIHKSIFTISLILIVLMSGSLFPQSDEEKAATTGSQKTTHDSGKMDSTKTEAQALKSQNGTTHKLHTPTILLSHLHAQIPSSRLSFPSLLNYDTSRNNPECRCYEIVKPISKKFTFLFNFMSNDKYKYGGAR